MLAILKKQEMILKTILLHVLCYLHRDTFFGTKLSMFVFKIKTVSYTSVCIYIIL